MNRFVVLYSVLVDTLLMISLWVTIPVISLILLKFGAERVNQVERNLDYSSTASYNYMAVSRAGTCDKIFLTPQNLYFLTLVARAC